MRRARRKVRTVRVRRPWDRREPPIKKDKVLSHRREHGDVVRREEVDGFGGTASARARERRCLLRDEAHHRSLLNAQINGRLVGVECAVQLIADAANTMVGVIGGDIGHNEQSTDGRGQRDTGISWVAEGLENEAVDICGVVQPTSDLVERTVFLHLGIPKTATMDWLITKARAAALL